MKWIHFMNYNTKMLCILTCMSITFEKGLENASRSEWLFFTLDHYIVDT